MQLGDLVKPIEAMTDEELRESIREIRRNRSVVRPAHQKHKEKAAKKEGKKTTNKVDALLKGMSADQMQLLLKQLGG